MTRITKFFLKNETVNWSTALVIFSDLITSAFTSPVAVAVSAVTGSLRTGLLAALAANVLACLLLLAAGRHLAADEAALRAAPDAPADPLA